MRYAPLITQAELKVRLTPLLNKEFPYDLPAKLEKDLNKVSFNMENYEYETGCGYMGYPCGYVTLPSGLPVLFVNAGGDWETPVCFVLYWDGNSVRGYIPKDGNVYDKEKKCAFSNDADEDGHESDQGKIYTDIMKRIQIR